MTDGERRFVPWVSYALAAANVIVFGVTLIAGGSIMGASAPQMLDWGGNFGPITLDGEPWRLLTSMFLHYGVLHLGMNMLGLVDGGKHVERMYGHAGFAALYFVAGLAGSLVSAARGQAVSAGASGAIFGVMGAFGAFLILHHEKLDKAELAKQSRGLVMFLIFNIYLGVTLPGIDMAAHLGGLAGGFVAGLALELRHRPQARRWLRAALVGVVGSAAIVGGSYLVPTELSPRAVIEHIGVIETKMQQRLDGTTTPAQADLADRELVPAWRKVLGELEACDTMREDLRKLLIEYAQAQEQWLSTFVTGVRTQDQAALQRAAEQRQRVEGIVAKLNQLAAPP